MFRKAEYRDRRKPPDPRSLEAGIQSLTRVFHEQETVGPADLNKTVHAIGDSIQISCQDAAQALPGGRVHRVRIKIAGACVERPYDRNKSGGKHSKKNHIVIDGRHQQTIAGLQPFSESYKQSQSSGREKYRIFIVALLKKIFDGLRSPVHNGSSAVPERFRRQSRKYAIALTNQEGARCLANSRSFVGPTIRANAMVPLKPGAPTLSC